MVFSLRDKEDCSKKTSNIEVKNIRFETICSNRITHSQCIGKGTTNISSISVVFFEVILSSQIR